MTSTQSGPFEYRPWSSGGEGGVVGYGSLGSAEVAMKTLPLSRLLSAKTYTFENGGALGRAAPTPPTRSVVIIVMSARRGIERIRIISPCCQDCYSRPGEN